MYVLQAGLIYLRGEVACLGGEPFFDFYYGKGAKN